jgi:modification target Cys-rich repeat protein
MVDCGASAKLQCTGTAPNLQCSGSCQGDCDLKVAASCTGTCHGTCSGNCSVKDSMGNCSGSCDGMCQGTCSLQAGGSCSGSCKGQCTYTPPMAMCDASAQAHCDATGSAKVDCKGTCTGQVTPPMASASCTASAKANASISADCKPPSLDVAFKLNAMVAGDAMGSASFEAWLEGFKGHVAAIVAYKAKLDGLVSAGGDIAANANSAINSAITDLQGNASLKVSIGAGCALKELPKAMTVVTDAASKLTASGQAAIDVLGSVGVS